MFELHTTQNNEQCQFLLAPDELTLIGRGEVCDMQLNDPTISRVHCRVIVREGVVWLYDAGSRWGTFVNGEQTTESVLKPGDQIKIGDSILKLVAQTTFNRPNVPKKHLSDSSDTIEST